MWPFVEADFHREYGVDLADPEVLRGRTWRWFIVRLFGLSEQSRTWSHLRRHLDTAPRPAAPGDDDVEALDALVGVSR